MRSVLEILASTSKSMYVFVFLFCLVAGIIIEFRLHEHKTGKQLTRSMLYIGAMVFLYIVMRASLADEKEIPLLEGAFLGLTTVIVAGFVGTYSGVFSVVGWRFITGSYVIGVTPDVSEKVVEQPAPSQPTEPPKEVDPQVQIDEILRRNRE